MIPTQATAKPVRPKLPPLENGDQMNRKEFHRRYRRMRNVKAELIQGIVHMASPVSFAPHCEYDGLLGFWLGMYRVKTPGLRFGGNATVKIDGQNEVQPDQILFIDPDFGGRVKVGKYLVGAPEFVLEVTNSTMSIDLGSKKTTYRKAGVREYVVIRTFDRDVDWFVLRNDEFKRLEADAAGILRSVQFPGLWLNVRALFDDDQQLLLTTLEAGLASAEHQAFRLVKSVST